MKQSTRRRWDEHRFPATRVDAGYRGGVLPHPCALVFVIPDYGEQRDDDKDVLIGPDFKPF